MLKVVLIRHDNKQIFEMNVMKERRFLRSQIPRNERHIGPRGEAAGSIRRWRSEENMWGPLVWFRG